MIERGRPLDEAKALSSQDRQIARISHGILSASPQNEHRSLGLDPPGARYGDAAAAFHWTAAVLVVIVGALGLLRNAWADGATQAFWINVHAVLGVTLWLLTIVRLAWRTRRPPPAPLGGDYLLSSIGSIVHGILYGLLLITPLFGMIAFFFHARVLDFGVFAIDPGMSKDRAVFHPAQQVHGLLAYLIFALVGIHVLAALWHAVYLRDGLLKRMWPWAPGGSTGAA